MFYLTELEKEFLKDYADSFKSISIKDFLKIISMTVYFLFLIIFTILIF